MNIFFTYALLFMIYSMIGWLIEETDSLILRKKLVNRGFLIGPYCPIYGYGSIFMIIFLDKYLHDPLALFIMCIVSCGVLEYFTSLAMEKVFKTRWWDYSENRFNINGRICLETLILFGLGGLIIMYLVNPFILGMLSNVPSLVLNIISAILIGIYIIDNIVSFKIILNIKLVTNNLMKDSTEEISNMVRNILNNKSYLYKRLANAFPNFKSLTKKITRKKINEKNKSIR